MAVSARFEAPLGMAAPGFCCRSSVVEHSLGKGEVDSSILSGSTIIDKRDQQLRTAAGFRRHRHNEESPYLGRRSYQQLPDRFDLMSAPKSGPASGCALFRFRRFHSGTSPEPTREKT